MAFQILQTQIPELKPEFGEGIMITAVHSEVLAHIL